MTPMRFLIVSMVNSRPIGNGTNRYIVVMAHSPFVNGGAWVTIEGMHAREGEPGYADLMDPSPELIEELRGVGPALLRRIEMPDDWRMTGPVAEELWQQAEPIEEETHG